MIMSFTGTRYPEISGTAFSVVLVMGLFGSSVLPYLLGIAADWVSLRMAFLAVPVLALAEVILLVRVKE